MDPGQNSGGTAACGARVPTPPTPTHFPCADRAPPVATGDSRDRACPMLEQIVPTDPNVPYDMKLIIREVLDLGDFFEIQPDHARNIVVGFGRMEGRTVGVVGNQPMELAGCLDIDSSTKVRSRM